MNFQEVETDAIVVGLTYGTRRRSGSLSEYLLALAEKPQLSRHKDSFMPALHSYVMCRRWRLTLSSLASSMAQEDALEACQSTSWR